MRKGYTITLSVLAIMILVTITVGTSYSYYSISDVQGTPNTLNTTCFKIEYNDSNGSGGYSRINLTNTYPMSAEKATSTLTPYTFTITNTCTTGQDIKYDVTLNTLTDKPSTLTSYLSYKLNETTGTLSSDRVYDLNASTKSDEGIATSYRLENASGTLAPGASKTFNLYLWINDDGTVNNNSMGQTFEGKVLVYSYI